MRCPTFCEKLRDGGNDLTDAMRIAYCTDSISRAGGIEKITVLKADALAERGCEVFIIVADHDDGGGYAHLLSDKVRLVNLNVGYSSVNWTSRLRGTASLLKKRLLHRRLLRRALRGIAPDIAVSTGLSEKFMLPSVAGGSVVIREFHFGREHRRTLYGSRPLFDRLVERAADIFEYGAVLRRYDHAVVLTCEDMESYRTAKGKVSVIPNFIIPPVAADAAEHEPRKILAAGRLTAQKNFASLIRAFRTVADRHPDWSLDICGEGDERGMLQNLIARLNLDGRVRLCGDVRDLQQRMRRAELFVLSSLFEGLPLVLLEAMSCGLPSVSYDCPCGPKDIIDDGVNGFLVPTGDERLLAERICLLIENPERRAEMTAAALAKSEDYGIDRIIPMWTALFGRLLNEKRAEQ